jgi:hypothetical protein
LGNNFCNLLNDFAMPPGSLMLHCSLSNLRNEGLAMYIERSVNEVRRFSAMFKNSVTVIPICPPPPYAGFLMPKRSGLYTTILCG